MSDETSDLRTKHADRIGFFRVDDHMELDDIELALCKDGQRVHIWMASNPKPGRYELVRVEENGSSKDGNAEGFQ